MSTALPVLVDAASVGTWSHEVDVLVVGFGVAGGCAAVEAADAGARVLVLDRAGPGECTSALAGGHFYLGGGTAVQQATGHDDTAEDMYDYLVAVSADPDLEKIRLYSDGSVAHFDWLESLGFEFERSYFGGKAVIQPGTEGLMYTGNEKLWPYREKARPAPRGHKVPVAGESGGARLVVGLLEDRLGELGGELRYRTGVTALVADERGRVVGATWRRGDEAGAVRADSVVLAAGGFVNNPAMVAEHVPTIAAPTRPLGTAYDDGLGIRMGRSAGASVAHMDGAFLSSPFYPPPQMLHGIIVNALGVRVGPEDGYHARTASLVDDQPDGIAHLVLDARSTGHPASGLAPRIGEWESIREMEVALGVPEGSLDRTLADYNRHAALGEDPQFHKHADWVLPLDQGPWSAFDLSRGAATYLGFTLGGLRTTVDGAVLTAADQVVAGLYAVGACASNIAQDAAGYSSGTCLGEGSFFGRRAGRHASRHAAASSA